MDEIVTKNVSAENTCRCGVWNNVASEFGRVELSENFTIIDILKTFFTD